YDGVSLNGWRVYDGLLVHWRPDDWVLKYDGQATGDDPNLWTQESWEDFQLIVDWRWPGAAERTMPRPVVLRSGVHARNDDGSENQVEVPLADSGIYLRGSPKAQVNIWQWPICSGEIWGYRT